MRIVVTRPVAQADDWVRDLQAKRLDAVALPLIGIAPAQDLGALDREWQAIAQRRLVVFVSPNAVQQFFANRPGGVAWPATSWAASPGPGTTRALLALGVPAARIIEPAADAAQFDSESLWLQLARHDWHNASVLVVRGDGGRDWLADMLREHGAQVGHVAAYRRALPQLNAEMRAVLNAALAAPASHVWLFSSSEAIANLAALAPPQTNWHAGRAIGTHPRIVAKALQQGFGDVVAARPSLGAVVACIQSFRP